MSSTRTSIYLLMMMMMICTLISCAQLIFCQVNASAPLHVVVDMDLIVTVCLEDAIGCAPGPLPRVFDQFCHNRAHLVTLRTNVLRTVMYDDLRGRSYSPVQTTRHFLLLCNSYNKKQNNNLGRPYLRQDPGDTISPQYFGDILRTYVACDHE